jgi:ribosomal protein S27E
MLDLSVIGTPRLLADQIGVECDAANVLPGRYSWRVKASQLAGDCLAAQWYAFRWVKKAPIPARIARIFSVGNTAEQRFVEGYRKAGWTVLDIDPAKASSKFPQWNATDLLGHMSMYADAKASHPVHTGGALVLHEYKTMNKRDFGTLQSKQSIQAVKPEYYGQSVIYLHKFELPWSLLTVECKDTQEIYREIVLPNPDYALKLLAYGEMIASSRVRLSRVAENPTYFKCKGCDFKDICHHDAPVDFNCRSCTFSRAIEGGKFACDFWQATIPNEAAILAGCQHYEAIR